MKPSLVLLLLLHACMCTVSFAQPVLSQREDSTAGKSITAIPSAYFDKVSKKAGELNSKLDRKTEDVLASLQQQQQKLRRKLYKVDSLAADNIFTNADQRVKEFEQKLQNPQQLTQYIPFLDTLKTSLKFLDKNKEYLSKAKDMQGKLDGALDKVNGLENRLQQAEQVKQFLKEQKQLLKEQLEKFGMVKQLKRLNKDVYYYGQQVAEYKEIIKDKKKIERKAVELLSKTKLFQDFMKKNSMLASLFRMPADDPNDPAYIQSLAGLQTRAQVNNLIQNQIAAGGPGAQQQLQNNMQQAQSQLQQLKNKMAEFGNGASDGDMPDFKPNNQKTKSFLKRIEYGTNSQSTRGNGLLPATSDIGLSAGYKINDNSVIGVGASYKMGWGKGIRHIKISHQGISIRSFVDYKLKAANWKILEGFWLSGGFEMNYRAAFKDIDELKNYSSWQQSGLIGLTKKLPINLKFFKNTKLQLLWDFLSYQQVPRTQALVFRVGYGIK